MRVSSSLFLRSLPVRRFASQSGAEHTHVEGDFNVPDTIIARDILFKNKMSYLREKLSSETRFRLPQEEFFQWLDQNDVSREQGMEFLKAAHAVGICLYYPHRAPYIYLRPRAVTRELLRLLDPEGSVAAALMENKTADLEKLEAEYEVLKQKKALLDDVAFRKGSRWVKAMMVGVAVQAAVMTRLIWWDLSWDVMEPIAYLLSFSYLTLGWGWYLVARDDIAEYGSIAGRYISSSKEKLYAKAGFSLPAFIKMGEDIEQRKATLKSFGVVRPKDRKWSYPLPLTKGPDKSAEVPDMQTLAAQKS